MKRLHQAKVALLVTVLLALCSRSVAGKKRLGAARIREQKGRRLSTHIHFAGIDPETLPLGVCVGDCDTDDECAGDLICFQRAENVAVPGCDGGEEDTSKTDYCIVDPSNPTPTVPPAPVPTTQPSAAPITVSPTPVPTTKPSALPTNSPTMSAQPTNSPTTSPSSAPTYGSFGRIEYVGNQGTYYSTYPMPMCKGDCDSDNDCEPGLYCHQRNSFDPVPYCDGGNAESSTADFCTWGATGEAPVVYDEPPEGLFRLKLYWEEGYMWQNETFEREWCMMYDYDGYPGTGLCWYGDKSKHCDTRRVYVAKCIQHPRTWFTFVNVTNPMSEVEEFLIMTGDETRCFERKDREISLQQCDPNSSTQRFFALNGDFFGEKFEISQLGYTHQCVTNDHHPKSGEVIETHDCEASRANDSQTSYWETF